MCGILGAVLFKKKCDREFQNLFRESLQAMEHRGPDVQGDYYIGSLAFGHVRLSIIDATSSSDQPMLSQESGDVLVYNGEIYNFLELRESLESDGVCFQTRGDTEVVLQYFNRHGAEGLRDFNGMFAFAYYDQRKGCLFLVRDRFGIKPLYYCTTTTGFYYASEMKSLISLIGEIEPDIRVLSEWAYYGNTLGENTPYAKIKKLLPGRCLEYSIEDRIHSIERYWEPARLPASTSGIGYSEEEAIGKTKELLENAVKRQLVSDVPIGVFLSGGIDSSAITAFAAKHYDRKLSTYSVAFDFDKGVNELPKARKVAEIYGTDHHELSISGYDLADTVENLVWHHDAPFSDAANIPLFLLSQKVKGHTKVILQGDGGDEIFGGYQRYNTLSRIGFMRKLARFGEFLNPLMPKNSSYYSRRRYISALGASTDYRLFSSLLTVEEVNDPPTALFAGEFREDVERQQHDLRYQNLEAGYRQLDIVNRMLMVDLQVILPDIFLEKVDRSTMAGSIEVRVPFLDNELVDFCASLPSSLKLKGGVQKYLLKKGLEGIVPKDILYGRKTGFGVPFGYWLKGPLRDLFFDSLSEFNSLNPRVLDLDFVERSYAEHAAGRRDRGFLLWKLLNFLLWSNSRKVNFARLNR